MATGVAGIPSGEIDLRRDRLVIVASSLGTMFEWYDFFVYGTLAALIGRLFFPAESETAALLLSLATFGAGFGIRPVGAILFGYLGDKLGRKYTFLATITLMGLATAAVGLIPTYAQIGIAAPVLLVVCRLLQGLALGGEYGGAAIYVAEHAPPNRRGFYTSFIQASVIGGFLLSLGVVLGAGLVVDAEAWTSWGWRIPFLFSLVLLAISLWVRLKLNESPVFRAMKEAGEIARNPLRESFSSWANVKLVLVALFGIAAGLTVIWYTAQFQALYFLQQALRVDETAARTLVGIAALFSLGWFILFGWLSDKVGRKKPIVIGHALTLVLLFPLFHMIADAANPALSAAMERAPVTIRGNDCGFDPFAQVQESECGRTLAFFTSRGIAYTKLSAAPGEPVTVRVGDRLVTDATPEGFEAALAAAGYPMGPADPHARQDWKIVLAIVLIGFLSGMTFGPVAALLVELFPPHVRYTSMSIPYHIGTGYFGGFLPFISQYIVARTGDPFAGLWYTFAVVALALVVTLVGLPETLGRDIGRRAD
jgi:MFS family permease